MVEVIIATCVVGNAAYFAGDIDDLFLQAATDLPDECFRHFQWRHAVHAHSCILAA